MKPYYRSCFETVGILDEAILPVLLRDLLRLGVLDGLLAELDSLGPQDAKPLRPLYFFHSGPTKSTKR